MPIILKHILRNIGDKKLVSALIIAAVSVSSALLYVSLSVGAELERLNAGDYQSLSVAFLVMSFIAIVMSAYVIIGSYSVIVKRRIKTLGTFRSTGITKRRGVGILLAESAVYAVIGAVCAVLLGMLILFAVASGLLGRAAAVRPAFLPALYTVLFALALSLICSFFPIAATFKIPVKDIILQTERLRQKDDRRKFAAGIAAVALGLSFILIPALKYIRVLVYISLPLVMAGFILALPFAAEGAARICGRLFPSALAPKNLRRNNVFIGIITLLSLTTAVVLTINTADAMLTNSREAAFDLYAYEIEARGLKTEEEAAAVRGIEGVLCADLIENAYGTKVRDGVRLAELFALTPYELENYFGFIVEGDAAALLADNGIILSKEYTVRGGLTVGDRIELLINDVYTGFTVAGTTPSVLPSGNIGLVSEAAFRAAAGENLREYARTVIRTAAGADPEYVAGQIRLHCGMPGDAVMTMAEVRARAARHNGEIFTVIDVVTAMATAIGALGIMSNLLIGFLDRRKSSAVLMSAGMSRRALRRMLSAESCIMGVIGGALGYAGSFLISAMIPPYMALFEFPARAEPFNALYPLLAIGAGTAACLLASFGLSAGASRLNIAETVKAD
jgi:putative ABC transport system permease protein